MNRRTKRPSINRRAFLRGSAGGSVVAIGLPFLESQPERSAWAQGDEPRFALFVGTGCGVVQDRFWPSEVGSLAGLASDPNAAGALADFADQLTFVRGVRYPGILTGSAHAQSYCRMLTGLPDNGAASNAALAMGPSIDTLLAPVLNADAAEPLALYAGGKTGWIDERMSFVAAEQVRPAEGNPLVVYRDLVARSTETSGQSPAGTDATLDELRARRASVIDLARAELQSFQARDLSAVDRDRLDQHLTGLRDLEERLATLGEEMSMAGCATTGLDPAAYEAVDEVFRDGRMTEQIAMLHMDLAAFAFACNLNHVATLQIGDGEDHSIYDVPSNERGWLFHHISHRVQSDGAVGNDALALEAHAEIDRLRLETFAHGLGSFRDRGLLEQSAVMWANQIADGPSHSFNDLPTIVAGDAGGALAHGDIDLGGVTNDRLLTTLARALGTSVNVGEDHELLAELLVQDL